MLRALFGEPPRRDEGLLSDVMDTMERTLRLLRKEMERHKDPAHENRKLEIWIRGLISSLEELEESCHAASFFRQKVIHSFMEDMTDEERKDYARYVYFYKNGFIRIFSILDKLGTVVNEFFDLNTAKVKVHFSYFTVLRQFQYLKVHPELSGNHPEDAC